MAEDKDDPDKNSKGGKNEGSGTGGYIGGGGSGNVKDPSLDKDADSSTLNYEQILYQIAGIGKDLHSILETGSNADTGWLKFAQGGAKSDGGDGSSSDGKNSSGSPAISYSAFDSHVFFKVNYNDDLLASWDKAISQTNDFMLDLARGNVNKISVQRFIAAYRMIDHYQKWLTDAAATSATHLHNINSPDSEFKGRAAYAIQGQVRQINYVLVRLHDEISRKNPAQKMLDLATALSAFGRAMAEIWNNAHATLRTAVHDAVYKYVNNVREYIRGIGIVRGYPNYVLDYAKENNYYGYDKDYINLQQYVNEVMAGYDSTKSEHGVAFTNMGTATKNADGEDVYASTSHLLKWSPPDLPGGATIHGDLRSAAVWNLMNTFISDHVRETVLKPMDAEARLAADKLAKAYAAAEPSLAALHSATPPTIGNAPPGGGPGPGGGDGNHKPPPFDPGGGDGGNHKPPPFDPGGGDGGNHKPPPFDPGGGDGGNHKPPPFDPGGGDGGNHKPPPFDPGGGDGGNHKPPPVGGDGGGDHKPPPFDPGGGGGGDHKPPPIGGDGGPNDRVNQNIPGPGGNLPDPDDPFVKDPNGQGGGAPPPPVGPFGGNPGGQPGGNSGGNGPDLNRRSLGDHKDPGGNDGGGDGWSPDNPWDQVGKNNPWDRINDQIGGNNPGGNDTGGDNGPGGGKNHIPDVNPPGEHKNPGGDDGWSPDDVWDRINKEIGGNHPGGNDGNHPGGGDLNIPPPGGGGHGPGDVGGDVHFQPPGGGGGDGHVGSPGGGPGGVGGGGAGTGPGGGTGGSGFAGEGWSDWSGQLGGGSGGPGGGGGGNNQAAPGGGAPMMPPMGGMGGGMGGMGGGGGGGGGRERERQTWLSEDEEVWGADVDLGSGVIGRPDGGPRVTDDVPLPTHVHTPSKPSSGKGKRDKADKQTAATAGATEPAGSEAPPNPVDATETVEQVKAPEEANNSGETRAEGSA